MLDGKVRDFFPRRTKDRSYIFGAMAFFLLFLFCTSFFNCFRTLWDVINAVSQCSFPFYNFPYKYHEIITIFCAWIIFYTRSLPYVYIYTHTHTLTYIQAFTRRTRTHAICTLERVPSNKRRQKNIGHNLPNYLHAFGRHFRTRLIKFHPRNKNRFKYNFIKHQLKRNQNKKTLRHNYWN